MTTPAAITVDADLPEAGLPEAGLPEDRAQLDRQLARLDRLADIGLEIAEGLAAQAKGTGPQVVEGDLALAYDRVARAVRMAVMLQSKLIEDVRLSRTRAAAAASGAAAAPDQAKARKDQVARIVRRVADQDERLDGFQMGMAERMARERLEHDDIYGQVMSQPVSELVGRICRDLGLNPHWASLVEEAWAQDELDSGEVGEALEAYLEASDDWEQEGDVIEDAASPASGRGGEPCAGQRFGQHANARQGRAGRRGGEGASDPPSPAPAIPTYHERLQELANDPAVIAAAGPRASG